MSEFIAAMALIVPLVMGVIYLGKYSDIKHQAIQASRYAALERALDPSGSHESDPILTEETRARFFTDGSLNGGNIRFQDSTAGLTTTYGTNSSSLNPLWSQMNGRPMLNQYSDVSVTVAQQPIDSTFLAPVDASNTLFQLGLNGNGQFAANVEVRVANIADLPAPLNNLNLSIGATTVMAGDAWNAGGSQDEANHFTFASVPARAPGLRQLFSSAPVQAMMQMISDSNGPQIGCVRPDVVPSATAPGAQYNANDTCY